MADGERNPAQAYHASWPPGLTEAQETQVAAAMLSTDDMVAAQITEALTLVRALQHVLHERGKRVVMAFDDRWVGAPRGSYHVPARAQAADPVPDTLGTAFSALYANNLLADLETEVLTGRWTSKRIVRPDESAPLIRMADVEAMEQEVRGQMTADVDEARNRMLRGVEVITSKYLPRDMIVVKPRESPTGRLAPITFDSAPSW
jgi:hypothetical protein